MGGFSRSAMGGAAATAAAPPASSLKSDIPALVSASVVNNGEVRKPAARNQKRDWRSFIRRKKRQRKICSRSLQQAAAAARGRQQSSESDRVRFQTIVIEARFRPQKIGNRKKSSVTCQHSKCDKFPCNRSIVTQKIGRLEGRCLMHEVLFQNNFSVFDFCIQVHKAGRNVS